MRTSLPTGYKINIRDARWPFVQAEKFGNFGARTLYWRYQTARTSKSVLFIEIKFVPLPQHLCIFLTCRFVHRLAEVTNIIIFIMVVPRTLSICCSMFALAKVTKWGDNFISLKLSWLSTNLSVYRDQRYIRSATTSYCIHFRFGSTFHLFLHRPAISHELDRAEWWDLSSEMASISTQSSAVPTAHDSTFAEKILSQRIRCFGTEFGELCQGIADG